MTCVHAPPLHASVVQSSESSHSEMDVHIPHMRAMHDIPVVHRIEQLPQCIASVAKLASHPGRPSQSP
jgi:hypothetical protein